jgi:hypothetical protein
MNCPDCGVSVGERHWAGCSWEQCPYCGHHLQSCGCLPPLDDRLPWSGGDFWLDACLELGFFKMEVPGGWVPCRADDPDSFPDVGRLLRRCVWNRAERKFQRRRGPMNRNGPLVPHEPRE